MFSVGIPASRLEAIFEPFEQADNSLSRKYTGAGMFQTHIHIHTSAPFTSAHIPSQPMLKHSSGLGLSICKQLSTAMGGKVWAESTLGEGSKFHFSIQFAIANTHPHSPSGTLVLRSSSSSPYIPQPNFRLDVSHPPPDSSPSFRSHSPPMRRDSVAALQGERSRPLRVLVAEGTCFDRFIIYDLLLIHKNR